MASNVIQIDVRELLSEVTLRLHVPKSMTIRLRLAACLVGVASLIAGVGLSVEVDT